MHINKEAMVNPIQFEGYLRHDGRAGIRNHVFVLTVETAFVELVDRVQSSVQGANKIQPSFASHHLSQEMDEQIDMMKKICLHPNVGGVLWICSREVYDRVARELVDLSHIRLCVIETNESQVHPFSQLIECIEMAADLVQQTSRQTKTSLPIHLLKLALECGGSDYSSGIVANPIVGEFVDQWITRGGAAVFSETAEIIGTEDLLVERSISAQVGNNLKQLVLDFEQRLTDKGINVRQSNPSEENKKGGITTIEEKSLGAISKGGSTPLVKVLKYGEELSEHGLHFMDTPSFGPESVTGMALGGCQLCLFTTGVGNPFGSLLMPTVKITARKSTGINLANHIDVDISEHKESQDAVDRIQEQVLSIISGTYSKAEIWGDEGVLLPWIGK